MILKVVYEVAFDYPSPHPPTGRTASGALLTQPRRYGLWMAAYGCQFDVME